MAKGKIAVIGDKESIIAFKAVGMETFPVEKDKDEIRKTLRRLANEEYSVIFITEEACEGQDEILERFMAQPFPSIIPIPSSNGTMGLGMTNLKRNIEKAIGADILLGE
ncbi:MAG: V-type ATP synthase subunit F [Firmicutes bacterium]|nr:V-type ATP synthase subunit F [Bacillota bacterium]